MASLALARLGNSAVFGDAVSMIARHGVDEPHFAPRRAMPCLAAQRQRRFHVDERQRHELGEAAGVPVVATRCGGPEEIVSSDEYGVLVPAGDADALAGALIALMESPERRRTLAAAAKVVAQRRFDIAKMVSEYEALYGQRC